MKTPEENEAFLRQEVRHIFAKLTPAHIPLWGRMDAQQVLEHLGMAMQISNGCFDMTLSTPQNKLERTKFLFFSSDRPLVPGFQNPAFPVDPVPYRFGSFALATHALWKEVDDFFSYFSGADVAHTRTHNIFGPLTYPEWLWFHRKHFTHHANQFGLEPPAL